MVKTFCPICYGAGTITVWESRTDYDGWLDEWTDTYECYECLGKGEIEVADKSGRETTGMEGCGLPKSGHRCTCGDIE